MTSMISNPTILLHHPPTHPCTLLSFIFALGIVAILFLLSQDKFTPSNRLAIGIALAKLTLCTEVLFLVALMHHIVGTLCSWLPYGSRNNNGDIEADGQRSRVAAVRVQPHSDHHHHHDTNVDETWPHAQVQNVVTLLQMFLMEVLDRVWEDMVMEEGHEQAQTIELPPPLRFYKGRGGERTSSSCCCCDRCSICLEDYEDGESCRIFECKHMFHSNCIDNWLRTSLTCPICRNSIVNIC